jgi:hypothetical protein
MPGPHQTFQSLGAGGLYGGNTSVGGGGTPVAPRSNLDYLRLGVGKTPSAEYPDGYLGTIRSRRDDRGIPTDTVLDSLKNRQNQRAYQRGVHKGERIDPAQYFWPKDLQADRRLRVPVRPVDNDGGLNLMVTRYAPNQRLAPAPALVNDGKANIKANEPVPMDQKVSHQFAHMRPSWS